MRKKKPIVVTEIDDESCVLFKVYRLSNDTRVVECAFSQDSLDEDEPLVRISLQKRDNYCPDTDWTKLGFGESGECDGWIEEECETFSIRDLIDWDAVRRRSLEEMRGYGWIED